MFEYLSAFSIVLVTGPHRSGTTICAEMIGEDTGYAVYREESFGPDNREGWLRLIGCVTCAVIQCPSMCGHLRAVYGRDDIAVVLMRRDVGDIMKSQEKIGFCASGPEHLATRYANELALYNVGRDANLANVKYAAWSEQRKKLWHQFEVEYESLAAHPLWAPKGRRVDWGTRQTHE